MLEIRVVCAKGTVQKEQVHHIYDILGCLNCYLRVCVYFVWTQVENSNQLGAKISGDNVKEVFHL